MSENPALAISVFCRLLQLKIQKRRAPLNEARNTCFCLFKHSCLAPVDIDECTENTHECDSNAMCHDEIGSYNCTCNRGYSGNGFACHGERVVKSIVARMM